MIRVMATHQYSNNSRTFCVTEITMEQLLYKQPCITFIMYFSVRLQSLEAVGGAKKPAVAYASPVNHR